MKALKRMRFMSLLLTLLLVVMVSAPTMITVAQDTVPLGEAGTFAVLAGQSITNTGPTTISGSAGGDVGVSPGSSFTGQDEATISGAVHLANNEALLAKNALMNAYNEADRRSSVTRIATDLGGLTLTPGTYDSASGTFEITGTLTLDAQGDPEGVFIFKAASTLNTAVGSKVQLINSARFCRTFWEVGSSATLGVNSYFVGHIFAMISITANSGAFVQGQLLAYTGSVELDNNTIINGICDVVADTATLHVIKDVINDDGGTAVASDFNLHVKLADVDVADSPAPGVELPGNTYTLSAGTYVVSEDADSGYTASYSGDGDASGSITLAAGDDRTVTITNNDILTTPNIPTTATLHVIKHVINNSGGTAVAADFNLHVKLADVDVAQSPAPGVESLGKTYTLAAGTYVVSEDADSGYRAIYSGDGDDNGNITLVAGDNKTVTITNNDIGSSSGGHSSGGGTTIVVKPATATLHVIKHVINDDGSTAVASDFNLHVKIAGVDVAQSPSPGAESPGTTYALAAGTYAVNEDAVSGYSLRYSGDGDANGNITLAAGDNKTVTITNNDIPSSSESVENPVVVIPDTATLHVIKHVINDDGGKAVASDFNLHIKIAGVDVARSPSPGAESPGTTYTLSAGNYVISEDADSRYTIRYGGDSNASGEFTLAAGDNKTVTITNNDIAFSLIATPPIPEKNVVTPTIPNAKVVTRTVTGGQLPKTSTPLYELLLIGIALMLVGALGLRRKRRYA